MRDLSPAQWRRLSHDGLNIVDVLLLRLQHLWPDQLSKGALSPSQFSELEPPVAALRKVLQDLSTLAQCNEVGPMGLEPVNYRTLMVEKLSPGTGAAVPGAGVRVEGSEFGGEGFPLLIGRALRNLDWFSHRFGGPSQTISLRSDPVDEHPRVKLLWQFPSLQNISPDFFSFEPFFAMQPAQSLALEGTTGLALAAVKRIAEVHTGTFTGVQDHGVVFEFSCPLHPLKEASHG